MQSGNHNFLEPSGPLQACKGTALPLSYHYDAWQSGQVAYLALQRGWWLTTLLPEKICGSVSHRAGRETVGYRKVPFKCPEKSINSSVVQPATKMLWRIILTLLRLDGLLIKYPQFPDVLNALNIQPHNIFLLTVWHCRLCSWARDFRNCIFVFLHYVLHMRLSRAGRSVRERRNSWPANNAWEGNHEFPRGPTAVC